MNFIRGFTLLLLLMTIGCSWAGTWDFNPDQEAVKHRNDLTSDIQGKGYFMEYAKINTNNLSMLQYSHGSGSMDFADVLYDEQKNTHINTYIYWIDYTTGDWTRKYPGASSVISFDRQYDNVQSPTTFAWGTGWYASHPVTYNSLLKDKNEAKSYQESASMDRQIEYARAVKGDLNVEMNCSAPTALVSGKGSISMKIDDEITAGTAHIGEYLGMPMTKANEPKYKLKQGPKGSIIEVDSNYIGDFKIQKTMKIDISKTAPSWAEDWLPCCSGGFFDIPSYNFDKEFGSRKGIFDCTCRNTSISTMKPVWNASIAQFPTADYRYKP